MFSPGFERTQVVEAAGTAGLLRLLDRDRTQSKWLANCKE